jgi:hypothetical protein
MEFHKKRHLVTFTEMKKREDEAIDLTTSEEATEAETPKEKVIKTTFKVITYIIFIFVQHSD